MRGSISFFPSLGSRGVKAPNYKKNLNYKYILSYKYLAMIFIKGTVNLRPNAGSIIVREEN